MYRMSLALLAVSLGYHTSLLTVNADDPTEPLKGAIDPVRLGNERSLFLKAAGVDSELNENEFKMDAAKDNKGFVRSFEKWEVAVAFDKNSNRQLDWFEARAYRTALRKAVFAKYDADNDSRLAGSERAKANRDLASGKVPKLNRANQAAGLPDGSDPEERRKKQVESQANDAVEKLREYTNRFDKDGDGKLNRDEIAAALKDENDFGARYVLKAWPSALKFYDEDQDERLSEAEYELMKRTTAESMKIGQRWERKLMDVDGDGVVTDEERNQRMLVVGASILPQAVKWADKNGDGEVTPKEWRALGEHGLNSFVSKVGEWTEKADLDGSGRLNANERRRWLMDFDDMIQTRYDGSDKDGDGKLSNGEMVTMIEGFAREFGVAPKDDN